MLTIFALQIRNVYFQPVTQIVAHLLYKLSEHLKLWTYLMPMANFITKVNPSLGEPPLEFSGGLPKRSLTFLVK